MKTSEQDNVTNLTESTINRRAFVKGAGYTGMGLAGAAMIAGKLGMVDNVPGAGTFGFKTSSVHAAGVTDLDIANFALNLEYLEAEFYSVVTTGMNLEQRGYTFPGVGNLGATTGGSKVDFVTGETTGQLAPAMMDIADDELQHVKILRAGLGSAAVAKPAINLNALGIGYASFQQALVLARSFEDTGVSAYGGAAPLISNNDYLSAAVRIGLTEAYHAGNVRLFIAGYNVQTFPLDSLDYPPPPTGKQYFDIDQNALAVVRTPSQVLAIVYHNNAPGTKMGGFFPSGVNGNINTV